MPENSVPKAPLPWWAAGLLLGIVQILAVGLSGPLGVSTQFVVVEGVALNKVAPSYVEQHTLLQSEKYQKIGYGFWLDVGIVLGAFLAAVLAGRWRPRATTYWWRVSHGPTVGKRLLAGFIGGFLILMGARFAHGCTSGQFASGWAQLSLSVVPFTVSLFLFGMITALLAYPRTPNIDA
ncbi:MAG: YeeE/YedE family protein [Sedimentisphaerales bacterium]|nr:YeeE/YedE family protein [Sedimentisphaerales bacterium]